VWAEIDGYISFSHKKPAQGAGFRKDYGADSSGRDVDDQTISDDVEQLRLQGFVSLTSAIIFIHFKTNLICSVS